MSLQRAKCGRNFTQGSSSLPPSRRAIPPLRRDGGATLGFGAESRWDSGTERDSMSRSTGKTGHGWKGLSGLRVRVVVRMHLNSCGGCGSEISPEIASHDAGRILTLPPERRPPARGLCTSPNHTRRVGDRRSATTPANDLWTFPPP